MDWLFLQQQKSGLFGNWRNPINILNVSNINNLIDRVFTIRLLWVLFFIELVVILFFSLNQLFDPNEIECLHASWKIFSGQRIYVDFYENHHPLFYYLLTGLLGIFKENLMVLFAARLVVFSMFLLILVVVYDISRNLFGKEVAVIGLSLLLATNIFVFYATRILPDVPQTLFGLISISLLFSYFQTKSLKSLILSSMSLGISFLFLQKSLFLAFIIGGMLLFSACSGQIRFRDFFIYILVFETVLIPYYAYLFFSGQLHAYLVYGWILNVDFFNYHKSKHVLKTIGRLALSFKDNPLLWISWVLSLFFLETPNQRRIGIISLILLIVFVFIQISWPQYFMLAISLMTTMAGYAIYKMNSLFFKKRVLLIWAIVILYVFCPLNQYMNIIKTSPKTAQLKKIEYVLSITKPADFVYDGADRFNLFRKDLDFLWHGGDEGELSRFIAKQGYRHNVYELIDQFKPEVISDYFIYNMKDYRIMNNYRMSDRYPDLFIRIH